jgi:hypothetical protein
MPILRQHHVSEARGDAIDDRDDFIAARNGKFAARAEVILDIDDQQDVAFPNRDRRHGRAPGGARDLGSKMRRSVRYP